jgi:phosphoglucosamine mutase
MMQNGHCLGGEQSGHIIFSKHATTGDGILTSLMIMEVILNTKTDLHTLASEVKIYPQLLKNVRVANKQQARENAKVQEAIEAVGSALGDEGRILVRESGTEPVIRVMVEAAEDALCEKYVNQVIAVMESENLIVE